MRKETILEKTISQKQELCGDWITGGDYKEI